MKVEEYISKKLEQFVVKDIDNYKNIFNKFEQNPKSIVCNYFVLLFGSLWFFYRKMYVCGILIISVPIIAFWIIIYTDADFLILLWLFLFLFRIYLFLFAYRMYWKKWQFFLEERQLFFPLRWSKGVSSLAVIIILILFVFYLGVVSEFLLRGMRH